jgi:DNA-binding IclR family transcriptional regulator
VARAIFEAGLTRRTRYTVVDPRRLHEILKQVRRRGYAATDEELEEGISSVAAPVLITDDQRVRAVAAVSVVGPSQRLHRDGISAIAAHAQDAAARISDALSAT